MIHRDWTSQRFNNLVGIAKSHQVGHVWHWSFQCDCGNIITAKPSHVHGNKIKSCGCFRREFIGNQFRTHGRSRDPESTFSTWTNMLTRCNNPNNEQYKYYGARGIKVCLEWFEYENFLADMGERPNKELTLERVDNNKGYNKDNCKWATRIEQRNNRRDSPKNIIKALNEL